MVNESQTKLQKKMDKVLGELETIGLKVLEELVRKAFDEDDSIESFYYNGGQYDFLDKDDNVVGNFDEFYSSDVMHFLNKWENSINFNTTIIRNKH